jgi:energy-coupling factor transporter ATP-binding protein EcfA2
MFDQQSICPYTGLRSFTEEESLYFKGRDEQIDQITSLLEKNKFLMLTGASGEGKSSLIYAGLIPNARAGFFKAQYSNWVVADFRPERSPVKNMAEAISDKFVINPATAETELRRGYSSLIDLYTSSKFYVDKNGEEWQQASDEEKVNMQRSSANLLLIADQFEEFFTNPENYYNEVPSQDSQVVVNLLQETARIALEKNIPVYVVCTMRSDYIGQCSAFRGLPDYIGFSQFFVPRLKRKDLKQVILEPADLSGNRISQRLVERLLYDLSEGVDQLPILQHALKQIWRAADDGSEEMDLIHYAKVGGMPANELSGEDQQTFLSWYKELPEFQRSYYKETGLNRVIEIHADLLYENAWNYYSEKYPDQPITKDQASRIIRTAFSCLTKIDNSRAVRNRMSLQEITDIIHSRGISTRIVGNVLKTFREEGNSFVRPFCTDDPDSCELPDDAVLDITHESLIRNWSRMRDWANREFEFYSIYQDFRKQLDRWKNSGKSSNFLLPIGPLSFFENWYANCRPNPSWIRRYSEIEGDRQAELESAKYQLEDIREFLKLSARKMAIPRAFMKYGAKRIATGFAITVMALLSIFYWIDAEQKQNDAVIDTIQNRSASLLQSNEINSEFKANYLLISERYEPGSLAESYSEFNPRSALTLSVDLYRQLLLYNKYDKSDLKLELMQQTQERMDGMLAAGEDLPFLLNELNQFTTMLAYDSYYNPDLQTEGILQKYTDEGYTLAVSFFSDASLFRATIPVELNYAIQQWLTFGTVTPLETTEILNLISPFENEDADAMFRVYYPRGSYEINGRVSNNFNGGYHTLASLYAAEGDSDHVIESFEEIRNSGQDDYFIGSLFNNYNHILAILYQFGHDSQAASMVTWLGENYESNVPLTIYRNSVIRAGYMSPFYRANVQKNIFRAFGGYFFPNLTLANRSLFDSLADRYETMIRAIPDANERNYTLAINKKRRAMFDHKYAFDRGLIPNLNELTTHLDEAVAHFRLVDESFLNEEIPITIPYFGEGVRSIQIKRRHLFIYPDYMEGWFSKTYHSDLFFNYIHRNELIEEFYRTPEELDMIHLWLAKAYEKKPNIDYVKFDNNYPLSDEVLERVLSVMDEHPIGQSFDLNLLSLIKANREFEKGNTEKALEHYARFDEDNFQASRDRYEYIEKTFFMNQMKDAAVNLATAGYGNEAVAMAERFEEEHEKSYAYIFMAENVYLETQSPESFTYLDSALTKASRVDFSQFDFGVNQQIDIRQNLILLLSRIGGSELNEISNDLLREMVEGAKFSGIISRVYGVAEEGNFYRAYSAMPPTLTEGQELFLQSLILWQAAIAQQTEEEAERWKPMDTFFTHDYNYVFYLPN